MSFLFSKSASFSVFIIRIQQIGRIDLHLVNIFFRDVSCCAVLLLFGLLPPLFPCFCPHPLQKGLHAVLHFAHIFPVVNTSF